MKKFFSLFAIASFSAVLLASPVLAAPTLTIELFHDDGVCDETKLILKVEVSGNAATDLKLCKFAAANSSGENVWGVRVGGFCRDVNDTDLSSMCDRVVQAIESGSRL